MRTKFLLPLLFALTNPVFINAQDTEGIALIGVNVFNGESADREDMTILIENGTIKDIFKTGEKPVSDVVDQIELKGYYVLPGLMDTHVHMGQKGLSIAPEASRKEFRKWVYSGVTTVRDMGGDARVLAHEMKLIKTNKQPGPDIYFSATVGSKDMIEKDIRLKRVTQGLGTKNAGYIIEATPGMDVQKDVSSAVESDVSGVKFYAGINADLIKSISDEAHRQGLKSWAHFTVFPDRPIEVVKAGVDVVSHVWGAFWQDVDVDPAEQIPFTHTDFEGARQAIFPKDLNKLDSDSAELQLLFKEMRKRKVIWDLTYVVPNKEIQKKYREYALAASRAGVTFCTGTDYFNDVNEPFPAIFTEIQTLVEDGILNSRQALIAATLNSAKAIGIEKTHGTIETGKIANLVVLKKSPIENINNIREIEFSMKNGVVYNRNDYFKQ